MSTPLERWVDEQARLFQPKEVYWCDGSEGEAHRLIDKGIHEEKIGRQPIFRELNQQELAELLSPPQPSDRRRPDRAADLRLPSRKGPVRPEQQLDGPGQGQGAS